MSIVTELKYTANLDKGVCMTPITPSLMGGDQEAHRITIDCYRQNSREPVDLSGAGVTAYFVRADGMTIPLAGETNGSKASVLLPAACYAVMGRFSLVIKLSMDDGTADSISTVFWGEGAVSRSRTDVVIDPDSVIPSLEELLAQIAAMEIAANNANTAADNANQAAADALKNVDEAVARQDETISQLSEEIDQITGDIYTDGDYVDKALVMSDGYFYNMSTGATQYWGSAKSSQVFAVTPGETLKVTTRTVGNVCGIVYFSSATPGSNAFVGYDLYDTADETKQYHNAECVVPEKATHAVIQGWNTNSVFGLQQAERELLFAREIARVDAELARVAGTNDALSAKIDDKFLSKDMEFVPQEYSYIEGKFLRNEGQINEASSAAYTTFAVNPGDRFKITTVGGANVPFACFYNSNTIGQSTFISNTGVLTDTTVATDYDIVVPENAVLMGVNNRFYLASGYSFEVKKYTRKEYSFEQIIEQAEKDKSVLEYETEQLERRVLKAEKNNDFVWNTPDKPYFVFVHDDSNDLLSYYADVFAAANAPMSAATVYENLDEEKIALLRTMVANDGEVLGHYDGSPTEDSTDAVWLGCTRDVKRNLEGLGFTVRGLVIANSTEPSTEKGEKYCRRYFDYATSHMGKSTQYNLNRQLMFNYKDLGSFKEHLDENLAANGFYGYGFHGHFRESEAWITAEAMSEIISYIQQRGGVITTYAHLVDTFGTTALEKRLSELEKNQ